MQHAVAFVLALILALPCESALAQDKPAFAVTKLTDHIYELTTDGGGYTVKVIASVGSDGLLLVDDGQKETVEALKEALRTLSDSIPDIIINTHVHVEHIGANAVFGKAAIVIGHANLRSRMRSGAYLFDEYPNEALPDISFADSLILYFNGEKIKLVAFPGAHDNSDIVIWFTGSRLVCVGALSNGTHFPSVDGRTGHILDYPETVQRIIDMLPEDVTIIPGHGMDHTMADYRTFQGMLAGAEEAVRQGLVNGKDVAALQQEDVLKAWSSFEGGYTSKNDWIRLLAGAIQNVKSVAEPRAQFFETMYYIMKEKSVDEAIKQYSWLKGKLPDGYVVGDLELVIIGDKLTASNRSAEAVRFYELAVKDFPDGTYAYYAHQALGDHYRDAGNKEPAIEHYRKSLELNAENPDVKAALETLEK